VCNCVPLLTVNVVFRLKVPLGVGTLEGEGITFRQKSETDSTLTECDVSDERNPQANRCEKLQKFSCRNHFSVALNKSLLKYKDRIAQHLPHFYMFRSNCTAIFR